MEALQAPMPDIASRAYNHNFKLDPIVRSLLDTDVYKLLMLQTIWKERRDVPVTFSLINRTTSVRVADEVDERYRPTACASKTGNTKLTLKVVGLK